MKVNCPSCMASLVYDVTSGKMECKFCGCFFDLAEVADQEAKETAKEEKNASTQDDKTMECNIYSCTACGAELSVNGVEASTFCAYCGQPTIVFSRVSKERKPEWIIPFKVRKEEAVEAIRGRFRQGLFVPKEVKNFEVEKVHGIYIPYWLFDTYYYDSQIIRGTVGSGKHKRTKRFKRVADCEFTKLTLDASKQLNDESSQRLEPFEMEELRPFEVAYMSGYYADCFDQNTKDLRTVAIKRTKELFDGQMLATVNARDCTIEYSEPKFEVKQTAYALFPAWFMTFRYMEKPYTMLVNGQTGKLVGAVPFDKKKVIATLIGLFALFAMVLVPLCMMLIPAMLEDEDGIKMLICLCALAFWMGKRGVAQLLRMQENEKLTSASQMNEFAHKRQQGGIYE